MRIRMKQNLKLLNTKENKVAEVFKGEVYECEDYIYLGDNIECTKVIEKEGCKFEIHEYFFEIVNGENEKDEDNINPQHYKNGTLGIETIDVIENSMTSEAFKGYCKGNVLKYVNRYEFKNGIEDLKKAKWYLEKLIEKEEK